MYISMTCSVHCSSAVFFLDTKGSLIHTIPWGLLLEITKLLIIGGVEVNPGPSDSCSCCCFYWCCGSATNDDDDDENIPLLRDASQVYSIQQVDPPPQVLTHADFVPPQRSQQCKYRKSFSVDPTHKNLSTLQRIQHDIYQTSFPADRRRATSDSSYAAYMPYDSDSTDCSSGDSPLPATQQQGRHKIQTHLDPRGPKFKRVKGFADMAGSLFEVKMVALLFIRGVNQSQKFHLASNMEGGGSIDDIVFTNGQKAIFFQLKHRKVADRNITDTHLLQLKGDFSLFKYCTSYHKIKQQWSQHRDLKRCGKFEDSVFMIYSNASMNYRGTNNCAGEWHNFVGTGGMSFRINEQSHPQVYKMFDAVIEYKRILSSMEPTLENATPLIMNLGKKIWNVSSQKEIELIFKELKNIEGLSHYKEFLSQLWFYTGQTGQQELDGVIKQEIAKAFGTSQNETQNIFTTFLTYIYDWWKESNRFLTEKAQLWENIYLSRIDNVSKQTLKDIQRLRVYFNDKLDSMTSILLNNVGFLNIVTDGTKGSFALWSLKVHQSLADKSHMIVLRSILRERRNEILALWEKWCDILVVINDGNDESVPIDFVPHQKSLIYVSNFPIHGADSVKYETITLNHLDLKSKTQILSTPVHFQGYDVPLGEITGTSEMLDFVSADIIYKILFGERIIIGSDVPRQIDYFIPRILECQNSLNLNILCPDTSECIEKPNSADPTSSVVFAISGLSLNEFEPLMPYNRNITTFQKWNKFYKHKNVDKSLFVIINGEDDFNKLVQCYKNVHWIESDKYTFQWRQSSGDISIIRNNLHCVTSHVENIETIFDLPQKVVLLSAGPGMGKTTLVDHLVCKTKENDPKKLIFNINLNESVTELDALPENMEFHNISNFLLDVSGIKRDFRALFQRKLETMKDVSIILDGFDEVSPVHSNKLILMTKHLLSMKVDKLWITTRCSSRNQLEVSLSTLCYGLLPLSEKDQQDLIMELWKNDFPHADALFLTEPCRKLIQWLASNLSDKSKQFVAVPLQAMLLAHAYEDELARCIKAGIIMTPKTLNLLQLFRNFIDKKFSIYYARYRVNEGYAGVSLMTSKFKESCSKQHTCLALVALFSPEEVQRLPNPDKVIETAKIFTNEFEKGYDHLGIIKDVVHGNPVFIHRTFAEFFAAEWFSKNYKYLDDYMREKLLDPLFQVTRHFFNRILAEKFSLHTAVLNDDKYEVETLLSKNGVDINSRDNGGRTALHLAVMNSNELDEEGIDFTNYSEIIEVLLLHGADSCLEDDVLKWRPLKIASKIKAWSAVNQLLQHDTDKKDFVYIGKQVLSVNPLELFKIICKHGFVELLNLLQDCGISLRQYFSVTYPSGQNSVTLLHEAVRHGQVKLVEFLLQNQVEIDARDSLHGRTPLILAAVQRELNIKELLESHGASTELRDKHGYTAALLTSQYDKKVKERICDNNILQWTAAIGDVVSVKNLLQTEFHINCINSKMQTALWCAAWGGKLPVVQLLLKWGADLHIQDTQWGWTPLHVAARWGYLEIVKYLVQHGASLAMQDNEKLTPFEVAAQKGQTSVVKYIRSLSKR